MKETQKPLNISYVNMALAWISIFAEAWLLLLKKMPVDSISVFFFCFFILVAIGSWIGTVVEDRQSNPKGETK